MILAYWLPRFVSRHEPAASGLLILFGMAAFALFPGLPAIPDPRQDPYLWEIVAELTVIIALFATGLRIDDLSSLTHWGPTIRLLAVAMPLTILAVALLGYSLAGMTVAGAILLGAVMAPTDPVLAGDVQVGPPLEGREHPVGFALTTEAALNDGLAFPFVYLGLIVAVEGLSPGSRALEWFARDVLWRIAVGAVMGSRRGMGPGADPVLRAAQGRARRHRVGRGGARGSCSATGRPSSWRATASSPSPSRASRCGGSRRTMRSTASFHDFTEAVEHALTAVLLFALGAVLPLLLEGLTFAGAAIALLLLLVVRPLAGWMSLANSNLQGRDRWVVAIYGVRGIGSIYYLAYAAGQVEFWDEEPLWALVGFTILVSALGHGFTAGLAMKGRMNRPPPG